MNKFYLALFYLIIISCNKQENKYNQENLHNKKIILENSNNQILFYAELLNDSIPTGVWSFYNDKGNRLLTIVFNNEKDIYHYELKHYDENNKIIAITNVRDGMVLRQRSFLDFQNVNQNNGRFLFSTYFVPYLIDHPSYQDITSGFMPIDETKKILNELIKNNPTIPEMTEKEMEAVYFYLEDTKILD